ncbi:hypothetical protein F8154_05025 [Alkaliphilus pronyensis]|uniref:Uncharacterized protein n=1 Tax=Alkaliphilus pronyensis TaxID=1482732 RepID=A0A6I0F3F8_9FIRM|nr:hypothetical protein [Alkaliphilus pronyensis]KAB3535882.1 hypothetical protein F8154_05025 [Alkaliphilus pronyensis]
MSQENNKNGALKAVAIVAVSFLLVPVVTAAIIYYANQDFRYKANEALTVLPGGVGEYFENMPTREEEELIKQQIAKYYITLEEDRLTDKLMLIKAEDEKLFQELVLLLTKENSTKMRNISEAIRLKDLEENSLKRMIEEIQQEEMENALLITDYLTSLKLSDGVLAFERSFNSGEITLEMIPIIFDAIPNEEGAKLLQYIDSEMQERIKFNLSATKKAELNKVIEGIHHRENQLKEATMIYEEKSIEELIAILGTTDQYNIQDLSIIYMNLSLDKGGKVLSRVQDNEMIFDLYENINEIEKLNGAEGNISTALAASVQAHKNYNSKINELVEIYQKMPTVELAKVVEQMLNSNQIYYRQQLTNEEELRFTNQQLVLDVLKEFKPTLTASLIENFSTQRAIELAQKIMTR